MRKGTKTFPTILGIFFLLLILVAGVFLSTRKTSLRYSASSSCDPVNPQVTNLTHSSFDYSFLTTGQNCQPTLSVNGQIIPNLSPVKTSHYFQVNNLTPNTTYTWNIVSGGKNYESTFYSLKTGLQPSGPVPASNLAWGRVLNPDQTPLAGAIIYLNIPGSQTLSAITNREGKWNISFATSFNDKTNNWFTPPDNVDEEIIVYSPENQFTSVVNKTNNNDPVPDIVFGQTNQNLSAQSVGSLSVSNSAVSSAVPLTLTSPKNNETITTRRPDIFGQATIGTNLRLVLDNKAFQVHVPDNNIWHWSPDNDLSLGNHQLSVSDAQNTITINFTVSTQTDTYTAFTASPSATLIPTKTISTTAPTLSPIPTSTPIPTVIPTVKTAQISTASTLYQSGNSLPTALIICVAFLLFGVSLFYYRS